MKLIRWTPSCKVKILELLLSHCLFIEERLLDLLIFKAFRPSFEDNKINAILLINYFAFKLFCLKSNIRNLSELILYIINQFRFTFEKFFFYCLQC